MSESAASAKRVWFMFGAKPAQSETPARARGQAGVHPEEGAVVKRREASAAQAFAFFCKLLVLHANSCRRNILELG